MIDETAEKVAFLVLHGAEPAILPNFSSAFSGMWRIALPPHAVLRYDDSVWRVTTASELSRMTIYTPATWDDIAADMACLTWDMIRAFIS